MKNFTAHSVDQATSARLKAVREAAIKTHNQLVTDLWDHKITREEFDKRAVYGRDPYFVEMDESLNEARLALDNAIAICEQCEELEKGQCERNS